MKPQVEPTTRAARPGSLLLPILLVTVLVLAAPAAVRAANASGGAAGASPKDPKAKSSAGKEPPAKAFKVPNHRDLLLAVPAGWKDSMAQKQGMPPTIEITDDRGNAFSVQISMIPPRGGALFNSPENLKKVAEAMGKRFLPTAKEKELSVQEVKGPEATGYFYTLTDKDPDPGGFEYITGGAEGVGDLLLTVTILYHTKDAPERKMALDMLQGARQSKAAPAAQRDVLGIAPPGANWLLVLPDNGFVIEKDQTNEARKIRQFMAVNKEAGLTLSVYMEPAPKTGDSTVVRDTYWGRAKQSPMKKEGIKLGKVGDYATVEYIVPDVGGVPLQQKNLNLYIAHEGVWVDVHVSKVQFTDKDQALLDAIVNGVKVVEKPKGRGAGKAGKADPKAE